MKALKRVAAVVILTSLVVVVPGCDQFSLDQVNPNTRTASNFWGSAEDAVSGTNAAYEVLTYDGMYTRFLHIAQENRADDTSGDSPWGVIQQVGTFNLQPTGQIPATIWDHAYQGIYRANQVLANIPDIEMDAELKSRLMGEAQFLRAHYYFKLVKLYNNVPLILEPAEGGEDYRVPQASPGEVWNQIETDLREAQDVLPESYSEDLGRATWGAATAYLGKAHLFNEEWEAANAEFEKIINSGVYRLVDDYRDNGGYQNENNAESIFEIQYSRSVGGTTIGWGGDPQPDWGETQARSITFAPVGFGWADVAPARGLYDEFQDSKTVDGEDDPRMHATMFYNRPSMTVYGRSYQEVYGPDSEEIYWRKYESDEAGGDENDQRSGINIRAMRYGDVLLMYAETLNELGDQAAAAQYIQQVRDRVNLPDQESELAGLSQDEMRDRLAQERFLELGGEGKRFDDVRRWGWLSDPQKMELLIQHDPEFEGFTEGREFLPIPQDELDTNPELEQNPGY